MSGESESARSDAPEEEAGAAGPSAGAAAAGAEVEAVAEAEAPSEPLEGVAPAAGAALALRAKENLAFGSTWLRAVSIAANSVSMAYNGGGSARGRAGGRA